jgi:hypothetical protein
VYYATTGLLVALCVAGGYFLTSTSAAAAYRHTTRSSFAYQVNPEKEAAEEEPTKHLKPDDDRGQQHAKPDGDRDQQLAASDEDSKGSAAVKMEDESVGINRRLLLGSTVDSFVDQPSARSPVTESTIERTNTRDVGVRRSSAGDEHP